MLWLHLLVVAGVWWLVGGTALAQEPAGAPAWGLGPFVRPEGVNPVVRPNAEATFDGPLAGKPVAWEKTHTFNPAAVMRDGKVFLLYRAEDASGTIIGSYTSAAGAGRERGRAALPAGTRAGVLTRTTTRRRRTSGPAAARTRAWSKDRMAGTC